MDFNFDKNSHTKILFQYLRSVRNLPQTVCLLYKSKENIFFAKQKMYCLSPFIYRDSCRATIGDYVKLYLFLLKLFFLIHYFFPLKKDEEETTFVIRCILSITWPLGPRVKNNREKEN